MQFAVSVVTVMDPRTGKLLDSFWCMQPSISDDNRFLAYIKVFPLHFVPGVSYEYLVYDLAGTPEENRTPPNRERMSDKYDAGWPVYPPGLDNSPGDNILADESLAHSISSSGFFWLHKDAFAFADQWKGEQSLVLVGLRQGVGQPQVTVKPLRDLDVVDVAKCKQFSESSFQVTNIQLPKDKPGLVRLWFSVFGQPCLVRPTADIRLEHGWPDILEAPLGFQSRLPNGAADPPASKSPG